ncbi:MAG: betaine/proline/choline family ABC transporter ATP-binding protein [Bacillota bacterium]|nr:betaine/proline/choline family ABC transporter ATP-binding protein [Bacillota bacterium]
MINLVEVTKYYPGQEQPAVDNLSLTIEKGETCVFVGPSGCGKSTTLRMINRMIEISSGKIYLDGKDILQSDPDQLRMGIGYVIQQIGLLPHRTIEENIAIVPRLHGWSKERIKHRVTELLELMGLDPEVERNKYPLQLSGGQMQRVGVARAMAADPPIMLMDEPFGAVDPIARNYLQDEFLRLQREIKKTICFVTHDINEAIKMGDKIAIYNKGAIVQHGTPQEILTNPANDFVKDFIGSDRMVKKLNLTCVEELVRPVSCLVNEGELSNAVDKLKETGADVCFVVDSSGKPVGYLTKEEVISLSDKITLEGLVQLVSSKGNAFTPGSTPLQNALSLMLEYDTEYLGIVQGDQLIGAISFKDIRKHMCRKEGE